MAIPTQQEMEDFSSESSAFASDLSTYLESYDANSSENPPAPRPPRPPQGYENLVEGGLRLADDGKDKDKDKDKDK